MSKDSPAADARELFRAYMAVTGGPSLEYPADGDPRLRGKRLGIVNGSSWITLWSNYFGRQIIPEVKLVNVGNEAVQLNFMQAHRDGRPCPPELNIEVFANYAEDLIRLYGVHAVLVSCSTMNRSVPAIHQRLAPYGVPAFSIDEPMMERAVQTARRILVIATHGPTVDSTGILLRETASRLNRDIEVTGATVETAFDHLGSGDVDAHNEEIAVAIRQAMSREPADCVVLAQLSMAVFKFTYPDPITSFGTDVLTSAEEGFRHARKLLAGLPSIAPAATPNR